METSKEEREDGEMKECEKKKNPDPRDSTSPQIYILAGFNRKKISKFLIT